MQQNLILQPFHDSTAELLKCFALGKPLSCDQVNFIEWHQKQLSSAVFDPVYKYYIEAAKKKHETSSSFLLSSKELTSESVKKIKDRLTIFLQKKSSHVYMGLTLEQFLQFKGLNINELIFFHGNQFLISAPFMLGGIPPVVYFQWGNFFGVFLYVFSANAKKLQANSLIYFENREERSLDKCVADYQKNLKHELELQKNILHENKIEPPILHHFVIKTPTPTLGPIK